MKKTLLYIIGIISASVVFTACKKETKTPKSSADQITLGLYQYQSSSYKRIFVPITAIGSKAVNYASVFDTGSAGMTIDAQGVLPASMITANGITVTGDSVVVDGITVTSKQSTMSYGDATSKFTEYGNLAYAPITIGDANGKITTKRIPFFIYYKIVNETTGATMSAHAADIFGVSSGYSYASTAIQSPLAYFNTNSDITQGFRLALLKRDAFSSQGTFVAGLLSIGLTAADRTQSGFIMHPLSFTQKGGYSPNIPATITYNGVSTSAQVLFDTGNPMITSIKNKQETNALGNLPANSTVNVTTNQGFSYTYTTTSTSYYTTIQNPNDTNDIRSIFSIDFFIDNQYLMDYANHQIGLKNGK
ncbi:MAG: hypothetical protein JKY70_01775 [Mucilaginibacter sp.]|nr:hypothetical protein [Mucilaginibacter sp.]